MDPATLDKAKILSYQRATLDPNRRALRVFDPLAEGHLAIGLPCLGCGWHFAKGDRVTLVPIGPGPNRQRQLAAAAGREFTAVSLLVHADCAGVHLACGHPMHDDDCECGHPLVEEAVDA